MIRELAIFGAGCAVGAYYAMRFDGRVSVMRVPVPPQGGPLGMSPEDIEDVLADLEDNR